MPYRKVNLAEQFAAIEDYWDALPVGTVNTAAIKLVKFKGEFLWHEHAERDEIFLVVKGAITVTVQGGDTVHVGAGEFIIIPAGVTHAPHAAEEAHVLLIEPANPPKGGRANEPDVP